MRAIRLATMTAATVAAATLRVMTGCGTPPPARPDLLLCDEVSTSTSSSSGTPVGCVPSMTTMPVGDECGVFVSSSLGMDANGGSKAAPVQTLAHALEVAAGKPIYACAEDFAGSVTLSAGVAIYGGL